MHRTTSAKSRFALILSISLIFVAAAQAADVPSTINVQAFLQTSGGAPASGTYAITVKLYPAQSGGTASWSETLASVPVQAGLLDLVLGAGTPLPSNLFALNESLWLGLSVAGEPELPRTRLRTVAYAFHARSASTAASAGDLACSGCVSLSALAFDPATQAELDAHASSASAHHARYTNGEAIAAMGAKGATNPLHHDRFSAAEAIAAMGPTGPSNPLHHDRYTDEDAIAANLPYTQSIDGKDGGTIAGDVVIEGNLVVSGGDVCTTTNGACTNSDTLAALGCGEGQVVKKVGGVWSCAVDLGTVPSQPCTGAGKALQWDGSKFACVDVGGQVNDRLVDSWGYEWDADERPTDTWDGAKAACDTLGGRLPTVTELFRVNFASGTGEVGKTYTTAPLWSITEWVASQHGTVRIDNGTVAGSTDSTKRAFRCVWPDTIKAYFGGSDCYGPADAPCWAKKGEGNRYAMDRFDRPPMPYNAAVRECAFYHAHLPTERDMTEEIQRGLPGGTKANLWTSDQEGTSSSKFRVGVVKWSGVDTAFTDAYSTYSTWAVKDAATSNRFRCVGVSYDAGTHPQDFDDEFVAETTWLKSQDTNRSSATYATAVSACWSTGGHVPSERDYHELIASGLPNGNGATLWTSDGGGSSSPGYTHVVKWSGVDQSFTDYYSTYSTWAAKNKSLPYRCVYYPIDASYAGPGASCNGGCFTSSKGAGGVAKMWVDSKDRPKLRFWQAVKDCVGQGGHLATERDMTELIREGLGNGTNAWLLTSDQRGYNGSNFVVGLVRWSGTQTGFTDLYSTYSSWSYKSNSSTYARPYRCVWSNELR